MTDNPQATSTPPPRCSLTRESAWRLYVRHRCPLVGPQTRLLSDGAARRCYGGHGGGEQHRVEHPHQGEAAHQHDRAVDKADQRLGGGLAQQHGVGGDTGDHTATHESATRTRTRRAILDATVARLSADHAASLADVAEAAGVGRTTVHRYFPERSDLLAAIGADVRDRVEAATARARLDDGSQGPGTAVPGVLRTR
ncbi:TetR/AcrR family transcriptional regulator [Streptomyces asiaticus]